MTSARTKFLIGGALVLGTAGYLMATSIQETGTYYLTPTELATKLDADPSFRNTGVKVGARVVPGSIQRVPGGKEYAFRHCSIAFASQAGEVKVRQAGRETAKGGM